jgi:hypothetical protein
MHIVYQNRIFFIPKIIVVFVLTFIKWRLTPSYAAKDTIFWQKWPKTIVIGIIVQDNKNSNLFIWPSMWTHAHCLETINNMWLLGKRESVSAWKKADFDGFREKDKQKWSIFQMEQMQDICRGSVGPLERTQGSATRPNSLWSGKYLTW